MLGEDAICKALCVAVFNNDAQHAVSQSLTEFQNILPLVGPLNSYESPLEAITVIIGKKKNYKLRSKTKRNHA